MQVDAPPPPPPVAGAVAGVAARQLGPPGGASTSGRASQPQQQQQQQARGGRPPGGSTRSGGGGAGASGRGAVASGGGGVVSAAAAAAAGRPNELQQRLRRDTPFICDIKFKNDLPEIPADPKLMLAPPDPEALSAFSVTSLERSARRDLLLQSDLGVPVTLLDADRYNLPPEGQEGPLDPKDAALLAGEIRMPGQGPSPAKPKRFAAKAVEVSWLMRTTYISAAEEGGARRGAQPESSSLLEGAATREEQLAAIEASFAVARAPVTAHPLKRGVVATEVLPILPDLEQWPDKFIQVVFADEDPAHDGAIAAAPDPRLRQRVADRCMLKSYNTQDEGGSAAQQAAVALLVPRAALAAAEGGDAAALEGGGGAGEAEGDYEWGQEYRLEKDEQQRPQQTAVQDAYLLRLEGGRAVYSLFLANKLKLRKRKRRAGDPVPERVTIRHRDMTEREAADERERRHPDA